MPSDLLTFSPSPETSCVPESIHQITPNRKQCEKAQLFVETRRQVITEKVSRVLQGHTAHGILSEKQPFPPLLQPEIKRGKHAFRGEVFKTESMTVKLPAP